jgi:hypothetical protein
MLRGGWALVRRPLAPRGGQAGIKMGDLAVGVRRGNRCRLWGGEGEQGGGSRVVRVGCREGKGAGERRGGGVVWEAGWASRCKCVGYCG